MATGNDQRSPVNHLTVSSNLRRQPLKIVGIGLDLHAPEMSVDHRDINAVGAVAHTEFVNNSRIGASAGMGQKATMSCLPHISVS